MDARGALLIGSGTAVAASIAVASVVALTSAAALADRPGRALADSAVVVHGEAATSGPVARPAVASLPETVPAPEPRELGAPPREDEARTTPTATETVRPRPQVPSASPASSPAKAGGTASGKTRRPAFRGPAAGRGHDREAGWRVHAHDTDGKVEWRRLLGRSAGPYGTGLVRGVHRTPVEEAGNTSGPESPRFRSGFQREQSHRSPDRGD